MGPCLADIESVRVERVPLPEGAPAEVRRVLIVQNRPGEIPWARLEAVVRRRDVDLVVFPEYAWYGPSDRHASVADRYELLLAEVRTATRPWPAWVVAGTFLRRRPDGSLESVTTLLYGGEVRASAVKVNPTDRERQVGVRAGRSLTLWEVGPTRWLPLICADVFCQERFGKLLEAVPLDLGLVPTASPYRPGESVQAKWERDERIFRGLARRIGAPVIKACCTGTLFGHRFQGRSLVATPAGILWRVEPDREHLPLLAVVDLGGEVPPFTEELP
jgi:predicted amidohydrolase